jgi:Zn-dependent protease with chaperone function
MRRISLAFKKRVTSVVISILLFFLVYLLLVLLAIVLAIACCYAGIWIVIEFPRFMTLLIGLGLMGLGISIIYFLIKFIFAEYKDEKLSRVQITQAEQPILFDFIYELTKETGTPRPRKIFVSPDVNACVFYNSSFWSMFLPVKKNLEIGLGLVNSINLSEFKAVMAHEFGHFSQRSMKLGSFTYNVNRMIHNMLYENKSYTAFLNSWGNISSYLRFFASLSIRIAQGIQWILRGMYKFVNRNYLGLSREMEFHADAVAAGISGNNNLISALSRIEVASSCYATALNNADEWLKEKKFSKNIFNNQRTILLTLASEYQLPVKQGLPDISYQFVRSFSRSRINYHDQWASHPTLEERKIKLELLGHPITPDETSPWMLFQHSESLQEQLTANLYRSIKVEGPSGLYDAQEFENWYHKKRELFAMPDCYKGFYDDRYPDVKDWDIERVSLMESNNEFDEIFNEENGQVQSSVNRNYRDIETVKAIKEKRINVTGFDFDGVKYPVSDCDLIIAKLETEISTQLDHQRNLDMQAFAYFFKQGLASKERLIANFRAYQHITQVYDNFVEIVNKVLQTTNPFYSGGLTLEQIKSAVTSLKVTFEPNLKKAYLQLLEEQMITQQSNEALFIRIQAFTDKNYFYLTGNQYNNNELNELRDLSIATANALNTHKFNRYKKMIEGQLVDDR